MLFVVLVASAVLAAEPAYPPGYTSAYWEAKKEGKPLLLLLTMPTCPGCDKLSEEPRYGEATLRRLPNFVVVDVYRYPELAAKVAGGRRYVACPQLCCFWYRDAGWITERVLGYEAITRFVRRRVWRE